MGSRSFHLPTPGVAFTFRWHPRWQFWRRRTGVARLLALDEALGVAHIAVLGFGEREEPITHIQHLPILETRIAESIVSAVQSPQFEQQDVWSQLQAWRAAHAANEAGAFDVRIGEAFALIRETVGYQNAPLTVESAYPICDDLGAFRTVRVIVLQASNSE